MQHFLKNDTQFYKPFVESEPFKRLVGDMVYTPDKRVSSDAIADCPVCCLVGQLSQNETEAHYAGILDAVVFES